MEQLQQTLNEAIKMWWKPRWSEWAIRTSNDRIWEISYCCTHIEFKTIWIDKDYHCLFSKDSWLMEFMEWHNISDRKIPEIDKYVIRYLYDPDYVYKKMWPMTAIQKIDYFNTNAYLTNEMP